MLSKQLWQTHMAVTPSARRQHRNYSPAQLSVTSMRTTEVQDPRTSCKASLSTRRNKVFLLRISASPLSRISIFTVTTFDVINSSSDLLLLLKSIPTLHLPDLLGHRRALMVASIYITPRAAPDSLYTSHDPPILHRYHLAHRPSSPSFRSRYGSVQDAGAYSIAGQGRF